MHLVCRARMMIHVVWLGCLIITTSTLSISSSRTHHARQLQPSGNRPPFVTPPSVNDINGNGRGSRFFNVSNLPPPTIIVRQNTTHPKEFRTIQGAVNSLKDRNGPQVIYIHDGIYREQVYVDYDPPLIIHGRKPSDNGQNSVSLVFALGAKEAKSNEASATLNVIKNDFGLYFVNVTNEYGTGTDTQALAINAKGDRQGFYSCSFKSFQDTVRAYRGIQLYSRCEISGAVDFIFGRDANAWFEQVTIPILKGSKEPITASGRHSNDTAGFYVLNNATVYSAGALPGTAYLGRPWRGGAKVAYQNSYLSDVINPDGWLAWSPADPRTESVQYQEFGNFGPGAQGKRLYDTPLRSPHLPENILGPDYLDWIDYTYRPILTSPDPTKRTNTWGIKKDSTDSSPTTNTLIVKQEPNPPSSARPRRFNTRSS
ncbi:hypothetical protein PGT21_011669 [Puccinia graminis f. sp. tritici]|uniref:Pectinesterase n=1 Tax=Puccinia graminis f. sp. tritici TaxID=56615 RepID=A0A5B0QB18_PUCGR|nr:hypothetical protein PGT21_011669 [Puccinia graminis f. sp. tritici]